MTDGRTRWSITKAHARDVIEVIGYWGVRHVIKNGWLKYRLRLWWSLI